jgi:hypothetical protein
MKGLNRDRVAIAVGWVRPLPCLPIPVGGATLLPTQNFALNVTVPTQEMRFFAFLAGFRDR